MIDQPSELSWSQSNQSRRDLLKRLSWCCAGTLIGNTLGCSRHAAPAPDGNILRLFGTGTLDIGNHWQQLKQDLGITLQFKDNENDVGPVITKMITLNAAEDYDLGGLQGGAEAELAQAKKIVPWDLSKIPHFNSMWPLVRNNVKYAQWEGKQYGIPIAVNADSMIYLPDKTGTVDSYHALFDRRFKGRVAIEDTWMNSVIFTAMYLKENSLARIIEPGDLSESELNEVFDFLTREKQDGQFLKFWSGWQEAIGLISNGDVWIMTGWEPIVYALRARNINAKYAIPKEGYEGWSNDLILHQGAVERNAVDAAHAFVNWELGGYYGCTLAVERGYVVPNDAYITYLSQNPKQFSSKQSDTIAATVANVKHKLLEGRGLVYWQNVRPKKYRLYEDLWSKLRAS